ncbi:hypothetical protein DE146DRAFT_608408 [Phaeosphaeria sp. MPI-PUGE-AT-0046c]|nr:hypothetical protein DE146DRAFT_608408 [Phaeosphaeria sp. MPI-PUGE-AT-0046c]
MDDQLPSYETAVDQDPWPLVVPYLSSDVLCAAALVCRRWHHVMSPELWGSPASHFGVQNDTVYVALTRFKRILPYVRPSIRDLTHTLHLPPAHAEIYGGPHAEWLRDCLEYLPRLQSLLVNGLPFFDHAALLCLRHASLRRRSLQPSVYPVFGLRLLDASNCTNATSTSLAEALCHFPNLVSLDLSRTPAARDDAVLGKLKYLSSLRLLSLKGIGLKDTDLHIIATSIATRVRSLDLGNNLLTDASARALLEHCLKEDPNGARHSQPSRSLVEDEQYEKEVEAFESENILGHVRRKLTGGFVGSLAVESARNMGITHLYLSNNLLTVEGISGLVRSKRLRVLDIGILPSALQRPYSDSMEGSANVVGLPGVSKLTLTISEYATAKLKYLRINHEIVTQNAPTATTGSPRAELVGDIGRWTPSHAQELEAPEQPLLELDSTTTVISELPGDMFFAAEFPASTPDAPTQVQSGSKSYAACQDTSRQPPAIQVTKDVSEVKVKRGAAFAPEPGTSGLTSTTSPKIRSRQNSVYYVEDRRARLELRQSQENRLHPGMLPKMHTLVLTEVPTSTHDSEVFNRIIQYIKDAAEETSIARQRAQHSYSLPPGRSRAIAEREHAYGIFALQRIVLEMAPPPAAVKKVTTSWRAYPTKSSTEDADSEAFWEAATQDFSFFGEEECGLPDSEPGRTLPLRAMSGLELAPKPHPELLSAPKHVQIQPLYDVVAEIAKFRKEREAAYNTIVAMGDTSPDVEGYWPGNITVVRNSTNLESGELDCYGNRYESGWLYR